MSEKIQPDVSLNLRLPTDVDELLRTAKKATGASFKHLVSEAVRSKYSKFLAKQAKQAA